MAQYVNEERFKQYLKSKTGTDQCNLCQYSDWDLQIENKILGGRFEEELKLALLPDSGQALKDLKSIETVFDHVLVVKCRHCGQILFFDFNDVLRGIPDEP